MLAMGLVPKVLSPPEGTASGIRSECLPSNDHTDLARREADIAVRDMRSEQAELIAGHYGDVGTGLYGAGAFVKDKGMPRTARDAIHHAFVKIPAGDGGFTTLQTLGNPLTQYSFVVSGDLGVVISGLLSAGFGVSLLPATFCEHEPNLLHTRSICQRHRFQSG